MGFAFGGDGVGGVQHYRGQGWVGQRFGIEFDCGFGDRWHCRLGWGGIGWDFANHFVFALVEADATDIFHGDVKGAEHELGAFEIDGVAGKGVDDFHEAGLDGLVIFDQGDGVKAGVGRSGNAAHHALMEVAELFAAKSGRAAADSGDFDVGADFDAGLNWHIGPFAIGHIDNFLVVAS